MYLLTRTCIQRGLAGIYFVAFAIAVNQAPGLIGERGLLPFSSFVARTSFWDSPSLLQLWPADAALTLVSWLGLALAVTALTGLGDRLPRRAFPALWGALWVLYLSIVNVGQTFYGFGWEILLLEAGFLAIFLGHPSVTVPRPLIWLYRWLLFRLMFGAGMIKIRGDSCWLDLTCLDFHYETQPFPHFVSYYFHQLPPAIQRVSVAATHFVELVVPFAYFAPRPFAAIAGALTAAFQISLIISGNLAWLNWITLVLCFCCFDDRAFNYVLTLFREGPIWRRIAGVFGRRIPGSDVETAGIPALSTVHRYAVIALCLLVGALSIQPAMNLVSNRQAMNASFDPLHLVNTYGAFGSVTRARRELVFEGTEDADPGAPSTRWVEYEFKGKPGSPDRMPAWATPYYYKLDWQLWFAAMGDYRYQPWTLNLVAKLLRSDSAALNLIGSDPFSGRRPRFIRVSVYEYRFDETPGRWWKRVPAGTYLPPLSLDHVEFQGILRDQGWVDDEARSE